MAKGRGGGGGVVKASTHDATFPKTKFYLIGNAARDIVGNNSGN